ncbi:MAG: RCC1 domain-containing protein [Gemmatimonadales bacterium]
MSRPRRRSAFAAAVLALGGCGDATAPASVPPTTTGATLAIGGRHGCRVTPDGRTLCWGRADAGQLGIGVTPLRSTPVEVASGTTRFTSVAAGGLHSCGLTGDGQPWCWGQNGDGQGGLPAAITQPCGEPIHGWQGVPTPHAIETTLRFDALVAGASNTCGFARDGVIYCWGSNGAGQLGPTTADTCDGAPCSRTPVALPSELRLRALALGSAAHMCGLTAGGTAYCWGSNSGGQLGLGTAGGSRTAPEAVTGGLRFRAIAVGGEHTCALDAAGAAWCWGRDILPAGDGGISFSAVPVAIGNSPAFVELITGTLAACGRTASGTVSCWGVNAYGEMGIVPTGLETRFDTPQPMSGSARWTTIAGFLATFCGLDDTGGTWCWGYGLDGELGADLDYSTRPVRIGGS